MDISDNVCSFLNIVKSRLYTYVGLTQFQLMQLGKWIKTVSDVWCPNLKWNTWWWMIHTNDDTEHWYIFMRTCLHGQHTHTHRLPSPFVWCCVCGFSSRRRETNPGSSLATTPSRTASFLQDNVYINNSWKLTCKTKSLTRLKFSVRWQISGHCLTYVLITIRGNNEWRERW